MKPFFRRQTPLDCLSRHRHKNGSLLPCPKEGRRRASAREWLLQLQYTYPSTRLHARPLPKRVIPVFFFTLLGENPSITREPAQGSQFPCISCSVELRDRRYG